MLRRILSSLALLIGAMLVYACSTTSRVVGEVEPDAGPGVFAPGDGGDASSPGVVTTALCPTAQCQAPFATCEGSTFPCDVNLDEDPHNCGRCGVDCGGTDGNLGAEFVCNAGTCAMQCLTYSGGFGQADCDGVPDNGCETSLGTTDNCGGCGDKCPDGEPCVNGKCGCPFPMTNCGLRCADLTSDDQSCGACFAQCDTTIPAPPNSHHGCAASTCGELKCDQIPGFADYKDCNGDLQAADSDGCEIDVLAPNDDHCGACGASCPAGTTCAIYTDTTTETYEPRCACPSGTIDCGFSGLHICVDVTSDSGSCGACGRACPGSGAPNAQPSCVGGECKLTCADGYADCNGNVADGCEVNLLSDPQNCGKCGVACDGVAGQACQAGECAVEPCGGIR